MATHATPAAKRRRKLPPATPSAAAAELLGRTVLVPRQVFPKASLAGSGSRRTSRRALASNVGLSCLGMGQNTRERLVCASALASAAAAGTRAWPTHAPTIAAAGLQETPPRGQAGWKAVVIGVNRKAPDTVFVKFPGASGAGRPGREHSCTGAGQRLGALGGVVEL